MKISFPNSNLVMRTSNGGDEDVDDNALGDPIPCKSVTHALPIFTNDDKYGSVGQKNGDKPFEERLKSYLRAENLPENKSLPVGRL